MSSNSLEACFPERSSLAEADIEALASRVTLIEVPEERTQAVRDAVERIGGVNDARLDCVAAHFLSMIPTVRPESGDRMLVRARPGRLAAALRSQQVGVDLLCGCVDRALTVRTPVALYSARGRRVHVHVEAFVDQSFHALRTQDQQELKTLLMKLCPGEKSTADCKRVRTIRVDVDLLADAIDMDADRLLNPVKDLPTYAHEFSDAPNDGRNF